MISPRSLVLTSLLAAGCTSIHVQPVDPAAKVKHVCIEDNPKVVIADFVPVVREGFARHGISTEVYAGQPPGGCEVTLTYTARQSWDMAPFLSKAELRLANGGQEVASAEYHLRGKGGLSLMKWQGTKAKMDPVVDELLKGY